MNSSTPTWRKLFLGLILSILFVSNGGSGDALDIKKEIRLIRRIHLDLLKVPPSLTEMEWYLVYNNNPYEKAIQEVLSRRDSLGLPVNKDINFYKSKEYIEKEPELLNDWQKNIIIKYQSGDVSVDIKEAKQRLINSAKLLGENDPLDGFDYLAECLMNRTLSTVESNTLLQIYKKEKDGFDAVFEKIKTFNDFLYK